MSLSLPSASHPARDLFDVAHLAQVAAPENRAKLHTLISAKASAKAFLSTNTFAKSVVFIVIRADGHLHLMQIGPKGGHKVLWDFGAMA